MWAYWHTPGVCGQPWVEECSLLNISMAHLQANSYSWQQSLPDTPLNDPVSTSNIMYSGHVASIGLLYEAFSGDETLSTDGQRSCPRVRCLCIWITSTVVDPAGVVVWRSCTNTR